MALADPTARSATSLPDEVITCLQNARFVGRPNLRPSVRSMQDMLTVLQLHLATCSDNVPHISLMNYTYLPSTPYSPHPTIIMTTPPLSQKTLNLESNPLVSLLVHDWVSHRPPTLGQPGRSPSPSRPTPRSGSLAELLLGMNTASLSRISTTINGRARIVPGGSEEEAWCKTQHLANNTFGPTEDSYASPPVDRGLWGGGGLETQGQEDPHEGDGGTKCYVEGEQVRVVVVSIRGGRIADWKGAVRDWVVGEEEGTAIANGI